jgi:hypothetical protein
MPSDTNPNALSTLTKEYIIVFQDGSKKWITRKAYDALVRFEGDASSKLRIEGNIYKWNDIKKVLNKEEYYREYPENAPQTFTLDRVEQVMFGNTERITSERAITGIIAGLKRYISSSDYKGTQAPHELLKKYEKRKLQLQNT